MRATGRVLTKGWDIVLSLLGQYDDRSIGFVSCFILPCHPHISGSATCGVLPESQTYRQGTGRGCVHNSHPPRASHCLLGCWCEAISSQLK